MRKTLTFSIIVLLLCGMGLPIIVFADTPQTVSTSTDQSNAINWNGQLNLSKYTILPSSNVPKTIFNNTWQKSHPDSVIFDPSKLTSVNMVKLNASDMQIAQNGMAIFKLSPKEISMIQQSVVNGLTTSNDLPLITSGNTFTPAATSSINVYATSCSVNLYWVQGNIFNDQVTIYNPGPNVASGNVIVLSVNDGYGYYSSFSNLGVGSYTTVDVPFMAQTLTPIGNKPFAIEVTDNNFVSSFYYQLPTDAIEAFNNAPGYLNEPNGTQDLVSDDLSHVPFGDNYQILCQAANAVGSNSITPDQASYQIEEYVYNNMNYSGVWPYGILMASDIYMENNMYNNKYQGVCEQYATLFASYARSLGIPTEHINIFWPNNGGGAHAIDQIWNGTSWVSEDACWHVSNNPQAYKNAGASNIDVKYCQGANAALTPNNPYASVGLLIWPEDWTVYTDWGYVPAYN